MEIDESVLCKIVKEIRVYQRQLNIRFEDFYDQSDEISTVEELMELKSTLLQNILSYIPLYADTCYFCLLHNQDCDVCEYAKYHYGCGEDDSDYIKIRVRIDKLSRSINKRYYRGETYE